MATWAPAVLNKEGKSTYKPETRIINEFDDEFDAVPMPDQDKNPRTVICTTSDMNYIKSNLPMPHVGLQDFYTEMARRAWRGAKPQAAPGMSPAFLNMRGPKGLPGQVMGMAIGARRDMVGNQVPDGARPAMPGGIAKNWDKIPELERINAYTFRGDKRHPRLLKAANGFHPPSTRTDNHYVGVVSHRFAEYMKKRFGQDVDKSEIEAYIRGKGQAGRVFTEYEIWRSIMQGEEMHIGRMTINEFLKGYISTSRSVGVATGFSTIASADGRKDPVTAVYAVHTEGGFLLPDKGKHIHALASECEVAHPGSLTWDKIKAFRPYLTPNWTDPRIRGKQLDYIFVRRDFRLKDPVGAYEVVCHLAFTPKTRNLKF